MSSQKKIATWLPLIIGFSIAIGIFVGSTFSMFNPRKSIFDRGNKIDAILEYINSSYVDTVDVQELVESSIPAIIAGLDPHSAYLSAQEMEISGNDLQGHFSGIGVQFYVLNDTIYVVSVIPGGPSAAAGIQDGDRIIYANDSLLVGPGITNERIMTNLRGGKGTTVKLGIKRYNDSRIKNIEVKRDDVPVSSIDVVFSPVSGIGYIKISRFAGTTTNEFIAALSMLKSKGVKSFIIDLRQNTGGYLQPAIDMANEFLERGDLIVYTEGRARARTDFYANGTGTCKTDQLVVLMDESSASASEVFAGAIQDHDRGLIIGRRSYGKGLVQEQETLRDGSALRLTVARYYTPSGRCIQKPYENGHTEDYSLDLLNRYKRGELDSKDSIKLDYSTIYYTDAKRKIYGNGGIMPDLFIPRDTVGMSTYYNRLVSSGAVYEYALVYTDMHRAKLRSFKNWKEMYDYLKNVPMVQYVVSYAESKGVKPQSYMAPETQELINKQVKAQIVRSFFGDDGYYPIILHDDVVLKKAIELEKANMATQAEVKKKIEIK